MRTVDVISAAPAAQDHWTASSTAASETTKPTTGEASTCGTAATRTAATPTRATAAGSSASTKDPALFPAFAHPLVEFVCAHAEHTDTRGAAGKRYRFRGDVRRNAGHRHSGRNNLVSSAARVCAGQPLNYGQTLESSP